MAVYRPGRLTVEHYLIATSNLVCPILHAAWDCTKVGNMHVSNIRIESNWWMYLISVRVNSRKIPTATRNLACVGQRHPFRGDQVRGHVISPVSTYKVQRGFQTSLSQIFSSILNSVMSQNFASLYGNFIVNISIIALNVSPRTSLSFIFPRNLTSLK